MRSQDERDRLRAELDAEDQEAERAEIARRDDLVAADRGRSWDAGAPPKPRRVIAVAETDHGPVSYPATIDPATALAMRYEAAGMERKPDGTWGAGFYEVDP